MVRIGLLVNPDAGLGGRLGLKGSDGQAKYARSMGAKDRAGPRVRDALNYFSKIYDDKQEVVLEKAKSLPVLNRALKDKIIIKTMN